MTVSIASMAQVWMSNTNTYNGIAMSISTMGFGANSRSRLFRLSVDGNTKVDIDANGNITANSISVNTIIALSSANSITTGTLTANNISSNTISTNLLSVANRNITRDSMPAGSILQVVNTLKTDSFGSSSVSWVNVTGLSVTITPYFSTSRILVVVNCPGGRSGTGGDAFARLLRNGTLVGNGNSGFFTQWAGQYGLEPGPGSRTFMDSPGTTSALTYSVQVYTAGDAIYIGSRRLNDFIFGADITAFEIAQ